MSRDFVVKYGDAGSQALANKASATRDDLVSAARSAYSSAVTAGGERYNAVTSYIASASDAAKDNAFDAWSESELKSYLDSFGIVRPPTLFLFPIPYRAGAQG